MGCDNHLFTQFFRNPHIIKIAELDKFTSQKWYVFNTNFKALNRTQELIIGFNGSEPTKLSSFLRNADKNFEGGETVYISSNFPDKEIKFDVLVKDSNNIEYKFVGTGSSSSGIIFHQVGDEILIGKKITQIKIKSNLTHTKIKVTWMSRTGK